VWYRIGAWGDRTMSLAQTPVLRAKSMEYAKTEVASTVAIAYDRCARMERDRCSGMRVPTAGCLRG
jgi:hypothetical protein